LTVVPGPLKATVRGLPNESSDIVIAPILFPLAAGVKVIDIVQLDPAGTVVPHEFVSPKSPLGAMLEMLSGLTSKFVSVTVLAELVVLISCAWKLMLDCDRPTVTPRPVRLAFWGLFGASSVTAIVPDLTPAAVGVKSMAIVQLDAGASVLPQVVLVWAKSLVTTMLKIVRVEL
jgi:hypothetical protein